ncbi:MAG: glycosyltransferase family 2 protein [Bacteroidota bacterium]
MLKIIIPMAGPSDLFLNAGYTYPKPLIEVNGLPMIQLVIEKLGSIQQTCEFIFIIRDEDAVKYHLDNTLKLLAPKCDVIKLKKNTKGGLCSVLMAIDHINPDDSLVILNGDQVIDEDFNSFLQFWNSEAVDAGVVTFKSVHPRWSYARIEDGLVMQTAEKNPISNHAIAGYYYFANAGAFFGCAFQTIKNDVKLDGNYYTSPVINEYILQNKKVLNYRIEASQYHSFYSPQMLKEYEKHS